MPAEVDIPAPVCNPFSYSSKALLSGRKFGRTMTTILFALPFLMYLATDSIVRDSSVSGGMLSSIGVEESCPILKNRRKPPFHDLSFFCACWRWGLCLRPMVAAIRRKKLGNSKRAMIADCLDLYDGVTGKKWNRDAGVRESCDEGMIFGAVSA